MGKETSINEMALDGGKKHTDIKHIMNNQKNIWILFVVFEENA